MSYYNKDYGLIDLNALASYYNNVLGATFIVKANCLATIFKNEELTATTLHATRVPFAIADVRSETMTVTFNFRVKWFPEEDREKTLCEIRRMLGYQRYAIEQIVSILDDKTHEATDIAKTFNCTSFLEMQPPMGVPEVDTGGRYLDMQVTGTILVTDADGGAVMSNDIVTFARLNESDMRVPLPTVSQTSQDGFAIEVRTPIGTIEQTPTSTSAENKLIIQALYLARDFEKKLIVGVKNKVKMYIIIDEVFDTNMTVTRKYSVLNLSTVKNAGAYMQYSMELQEFDATEIS